MRSGSDKGSTLIELLISITIVGVILVIIMGAFRIGIRAWETGERDVEGFQRQQIVLSIVKRQLASACNRPITIEDEEPFAFKGDSKVIDFVSSVAIVPGNEFGKVWVTYRIGQNDENDLYYLEIAERDFLTGGAQAAIDTLGEDSVFNLIADVYDIRFDYLKEIPREEKSEWQPEWGGKEDVGLPAAVRCILQMEEKHPPITIIARILSVADAT